MVLSLATCHLPATAEPSGEDGPLATSLADTHYVDVSNAVPTHPYTSWATAATVIQDAVDAAQGGDTVLVTNGTYDVGARATPGALLLNRVVVTNSVVVKSVNGPDGTIIEGAGPLGSNAVRCVYITAGRLEGFTAMNGHTLTNGDWILDQKGGGTYARGGSLTNCVLSGNAAHGSGGGSYDGTLYSCTLASNSAYWGGGGTEGGTLYNCTVSGNSAVYDAGGSYNSTLSNCIVYYNDAIRNPNTLGCVCSNCCTTPLPEGTGNITEAPMLVTPARIATNSPCVGAGCADYVTGVDIDNEAWGNPPSIGCDEPRHGTLTGRLSVAIMAQATNVAVDTTVGFTAHTEGRVSRSAWSYGDGSEQTNSCYAHHAWGSTGVYDVVLRVCNESYPAGVAATVTVHVCSAGAMAKYVWQDSPLPAWPYDRWSNAAHTIQEAVDAQTVYGGLVWVTNGIYADGATPTPGGSQSNRVVITNNIVVRSVNGPEVTVIEGTGPPGDGAVRCVYITAGRLEDLTLANGHTRTNGIPHLDRSGGGAFALGGVLTNCALTGNSADNGGGSYYGTLDNCTLHDCVLSGNSAGYGGGAFRSTLHNCRLTTNSASWTGGGLSRGTVYNCALSGNSAEEGGGAQGATLNNCTLSGNSADYGGGSYWSTLNSTLLG